MTVTSAHFRELLASLPAGVSIVTTRDGDTLHGATCSAVCSVSADPPQLLVCLDQGSRTSAAVCRSGGFAVNVLRDSGQPLASRFASPADRFAGLEVHDRAGVPVLPAEQLVAWAACEVLQVVPAGTHNIILGAVLDGSALPQPPLLYFQRAYRRLDLAPAG